MSTLSAKIGITALNALSLSSYATSGTTIKLIIKIVAKIHLITVTVGDVNVPMGKRTYSLIRTNTVYAKSKITQENKKRFLPLFNLNCFDILSTIVKSIMLIRILIKALLSTERVQTLSMLLISQEKKLSFSPATLL